MASVKDVDVCADLLFVFTTTVYQPKLPVGMRFVPEQVYRE